MFVKDVMNTKSPVLHEEDTILHASKFMQEERIRNLPVVDKNNKLTGLITLREIINTVFESPAKILVKDAMIKQVVAITADKSLKDALETMMANKFGCLPVIDNEKKLIGFVSEADLLKTLYKLSPINV